MLRICQKKYYKTAKLGNIHEHFLNFHLRIVAIRRLETFFDGDSFRLLQGLDVDIACGYVWCQNGDGLILGFLDENMRVWYLPENAVNSVSFRAGLWLSHAVCSSSVGSSRMACVSEISPTMKST